LLKIDAELIRKDIKKFEEDEEKLPIEVRKLVKNRRAVTETLWFFNSTSELGYAT
jgi:hypothetical protein